LETNLQFKIIHKIFGIMQEKANTEGTMQAAGGMNGAKGKTRRTIFCIKLS
jgi:hypothetical protein